MDMLKWLNDITQSAIKYPLPVFSQTIPCSAISQGNNTDGFALSQGNFVRDMVDKYNLPVALLPMDLSVEAELFGCNLDRFNGNDCPLIAPAFSLKEQNSLKQIRMPKIEGERFGILIDSIKETKRLLPDRPLFAWCVGPFTLATLLFPFEEILSACDDFPDLMDELMEKLTFFVTEYILTLKGAGADGVFISETAAGYISPSLNAEYSAPFVSKISAEVQSSSFITAYHNHGPKVAKQIGNVMDTGCKIFHFGENTDLLDICNFIPDEVLFLGSVSKEAFLSVDNMKENVDSLLGQCGHRRNFVLSSACNIPMDFNTEVMDEFFRAVKEYYQG